MSAPSKSRKARLELSGTLGAAKEWTPTAADWKSIENACGLDRGEKFDDDLRSAIRAAVANYFKNAPAETNAPFRDDFAEKIREAAKLARQLTDALYAVGTGIEKTAFHWDYYFPPEIEDTSDDAPAEGQALIDHILRDGRKPRRYRRDIAETASVIWNVLNDTLRDTTRDDAPGWEETEEWKRLIRALNRAFNAKAAKLPTALAKKLKVSTAKNAYGKESPFVRFVRALQATFDEEFRRYEGEFGLSVAVRKALNFTGKKVKTGAKPARSKTRKLPQSRRKRA